MPAIQSSDSKLRCSPQRPGSLLVEDLSDQEQAGKAKQKQTTLDFWDAYHGDSSVDVPSKEWILTDSTALLDLIASFLPSVEDANPTEAGDNKVADRVVNVLEIGCGTSTLSRSLLHHLTYARQRKDSNTGDMRYSMTSTDVSFECIKQNRARDAEFMSRSDKHVLQYETLDILSDRLTFGAGGTDAFSPSSYDIVLDKGCLDTFLYRNSRKDKRRAHHPPLLSVLVNNVHKLLRPNGKYIIISPRSKIRSVRDFAGFKEINRIKVDANSIGRGTLDGKEEPQPSSFAYMYICMKNDDYSPGVDKPFRNMCSVEEDTSACHVCGVSFLDFRSSEGLEGKGGLFWARKWKGHRVHCKADQHR